MPPIPKLSDFPQGGRVVLPGFSPPALHDRARRATAAPPPTTPTSTPTRAPTPAEEAFAARPDAEAVIAERADRAQRMMAAGASDEAERIRREPRAVKADDSAEQGDE